MTDIERAIKQFEDYLDAGDDDFAVLEFDTASMGLWALQEAQARENPKPLTLGELRQHVDRWVWVIPLIGPYERCCTKVRKVKNGYVYFSDCGRHMDHAEEWYGQTWIAYDYPPKEV